MVQTSLRAQATTADELTGSAQHPALGSYYADVSPDEAGVWAHEFRTAGDSTLVEVGCFHARVSHVA